MAPMNHTTSTPDLAQQIGGLLAQGPARYQAVCAALATVSDGTIARTLSQMESRGLVRRRGALWERVTMTALVERNGQSHTGSSGSLACTVAGCDFRARTQAGLGVHIARSHGKPRPRSAPRRRRHKDPSHAPGRAAGPQVPVMSGSTLERLRKLQPAVAQAIAGLEALDALGFSL